MPEGLIATLTKRFADLSKQVDLILNGSLLKVFDSDSLPEQVREIEYSQMVCSKYKLTLSLQKLLTGAQLALSSKVTISLEYFVEIAQAASAVQTIKLEKQGLGKDSTTVPVKWCDAVLSNFNNTAKSLLQPALIATHDLLKDMFGTVDVEGTSTQELG